MDKVQIAKTVVNNLTSITVVALSHNIMQAHRKHSNNAIVELVFDASSLLAAFALAGLVQERMDAYMDSRIDELVDTIRSIKNPKPKLVA
jgi:hypothetical protein